MTSYPREWVNNLKSLPVELAAPWGCELLLDLCLCQSHMITSLWYCRNGFLHELVIGGFQTILTSLHSKKHFFHCNPVYKCVSTDFPCYLKVDISCETFCKLKWHKVKKQLPVVVYINFFWMFSHPKNKLLNHIK